MPRPDGQPCGGPAKYDSRMVVVMVVVVAVVVVAVVLEPPPQLTTQTRATMVGLCGVHAHNLREVVFALRRCFGVVSQPIRV